MLQLFPVTKSSCLVFIQHLYMQISQVVFQNQINLSVVTFTLIVLPFTLILLLRIYVSLRFLNFLFYFIALPTHRVIIFIDSISIEFHISSCKMHQETLWNQSDERVNERYCAFATIYNLFWLDG